MNICIDENDIKNCISNLDKNKKYLNIRNNLFWFKYILTINNLEYDFDNLFHNVYFQFSYDDGVKKEIIFLKHYYPQTDCYDFLYKNKIFTQDVIDEIKEEVHKIIINSWRLIEQCNIDKYVYELALSKVKDKNDFIKKYEDYIDNAKKVASNANNMMLDLCKKVIETKFNEG